MKVWNDVILHFALKEEVAPQDNLFYYILKHRSELLERHLLHLAATDGRWPDDVDVVAFALFVFAYGLEQSAHLNGWLKRKSCTLQQPYDTLPIACRELSATYGSLGDEL